MEEYADDPDAQTSTSIMVSNPMRANGGILGRGFEGLTIPIIGITFYGATPTDSCRRTCGPVAS